MPVKVIFECSGCAAKAEGTDRLRREFNARDVNTVDDITPAGWVAYDPWTYCTYCPECYESIGEPKEEVR